jgi:hypothetical protein
MEKAQSCPHRALSDTTHDRLETPRDIRRSHMSGNFISTPSSPWRSIDVPIWAPVRPLSEDDASRVIAPVIDRGNRVLMGAQSTNRA